MHINLTPQGLTTGVPERGDHAWPATARLLPSFAKAVTERYGCGGNTVKRHEIKEVVL